MMITGIRIFVLFSVILLILKYVLHESLIFLFLDIPQLVIHLHICLEYDEP